MKLNNGGNEGNLTLRELANVIAQHQKLMNSLESLVSTYFETKSEIELEAEKTSAFDSNLSNESQRKAARLDVLANDVNYKACKIKLEEARVKHKDAVCEWERLKRLYRAVELEKLGQIVEKGTSTPLLK